ncbi:MAG: DUF3099 domain-containing protein [Tetrasphaera sp.]
MRKVQPGAVQSVTTAHESLEAEQLHRIKRYLVTMAIRTICFVAAVPLQGWMRWTSVALAVVLPYFAVVMANAVRPRLAGDMQSVTPVVPLIHHEADVAPSYVVDRERPA